MILEVGWHIFEETQRLDRGTLQIASHIRTQFHIWRFMIEPCSENCTRKRKNGGERENNEVIIACLIEPALVIQLSISCHWLFQDLAQDLHRRYAEREEIVYLQRRFTQKTGVVPCLSRPASQVPQVKDRSRLSCSRMDCLPGHSGIREHTRDWLDDRKKRITSGPKYHLKTTREYQTSKVVGYLSDAPSKPPK